MEENIITTTPAEEAIGKLPENPTPADIARYAVAVLDMKKARDLKLLHTTEQTVIADYFVIASGTSRTHMKTLADELSFKLGENGVPTLRTEGDGSGGWILIDLGSVIVHVFGAEARQFYNLEKLYGKASEEDISALVSEN